MAYNTKVLANNPKVYCRLGEASGAVAADEMAFQDGAYVGSPTLGVAGLVLDANTCMTLVNSNQGVEFPAAANISYDPNWTIEFVFVPSVIGGNYTLVSARAGTGTWQSINFRIHTGLSFQLTIKNSSFGSASINGTVIFEVGKKYHIALRMHSTNGMEVFVNGISDGTNANTAVYNNGALGVICFGFYYQYTNSMLGEFDEIATYLTALSDADILDHAQETTLPQITTNVPSLDGSVIYNAPVSVVGTFTQVPSLDGSVTYNAPYAVVNPSELLKTKTVYQLVLTGAADSTTDLVLPFTSIQARKRQSQPTYLAVVVPAGKDFINEINSRSNGDIVVKRGFENPDKSLQLEEISRATLETIRSDEGSKQSSVTLSGHKTITFEPKTRELTGANYKNVSNGVSRYRSLVDNYLNPGDTALINGDSIVVESITYTIGTNQENMEISEVS